MSKVHAIGRGQAADILREVRAAGFAVRVVRRGYHWILDGGAGGVFELTI